MSIDLKLVEPTADVLEILLIKTIPGTLVIPTRAPLRGRLTPPATLPQGRMQLTETCK